MSNMAENEPVVTEDPVGGPWGDAMDVILCLFPLAFLVATTLLQRIRLPTVKSLPMAAALMWFIRLAYLSSRPNEVTAAVVVGALEAITPLSIIFGAILLFSTMQHTMCLPWITQEIKNMTKGHPVAEVFLIGWAFAYLVEGASGFGTPAALGAPMLVELGHPPVQSVVCLLIMNTLATPFGAVGTPLWFGFGDLGLSDDDLLLVGLKTSVINTVVAHIVPLIAASFLVPWRDMFKSKFFILVSIWSCVVPATALSVVSYEFSTIIGGATGVIITGAMAMYHFGLGPASFIRGEEPTDVPPQAGQPSTNQTEFSHMPEKFYSKKPYKLETQRSASFDLTTSISREDSVPIGALSLETQVERSSSFHSPLSGFSQGSMGRRVRNRLYLPISYGPSKFKHPLVAHSMNAEVGGMDMVGATSDGSNMHHETLALCGGMTSKEETPESVSHEASQEIGEPASMVALNVQMASPTKEPLAQVSKWKSAIPTVTRTMPLWGTVLLLVITRIPQFGIKDLLQETDPHVKIDLGTLGYFRLSPALVLSLSEVLEEQNIRWSYQMLFVPFILPFVVISCVTIMLFRRDIPNGVKWWTPFKDTFKRMGSITIALVGALVLVSLIRTGGNASPAFIIGSVLSDALDDAFVLFSPFVGALGSFFSGSSTVSNLTFGPVQKVAALRMDRPVTSFLALQCVGATIGNMICINNIISARAVLGLEQSEGEFIQKTGPVAVLYAILGALIGMAFVF